jgi:hypothetical protein
MKEGQYGGYALYMHMKNRTMNPFETVLRRREGR